MEAKQIQHQLKQKQEQIEAAERSLSLIRREEDELKQTLAVLQGMNRTTEPETKKEAKLVNEKNKQLRSNMVEKEEKEQENQKKWYVIYDGPFKGIYNNWAIANRYITEKAVTHQSFNKKEEALAAIAKVNSHKKAVISEQTRKKKMISLGKKPIPNHFEKIKNIITTGEKIKMKSLNKEKFERIVDSVIHYTELQSTLMFYPKNKGVGPKVVFITGANPLTVYQYYQAGLIDTLYVQDGKEVSEFPAQIQYVIKSYNEKFAKGREIYLKFISSYPLFTEDGEVQVPSLSLVLMGISNGRYLISDTIEGQIPTTESVARSIAGVYMASLQLGQPKNKQIAIKINYYSTTMMIYSNFDKEISEQDIQTILKFKGPFEHLTGVLEKLPEEVKESLCKKIKAVGRKKEDKKSDDKEEIIME